MDDMLFGAKRAYWASFRFAWWKTRPFCITPARVNLLRVLYTAPHRFKASQLYIRHHLGVAGSVVSRMVRALERLGLVTRERDDEDRRRKVCVLTAAGRKLLELVWEGLVRSRVIEAGVDRCWPEPAAARAAAAPIFAGLTLTLGRWGPMRAP
jgi:DNA-binding MarR family transcriptional regulator